MPELYHYVGQLDNGKWMEVLVVFEFNLNIGKEIGRVIGIKVYDKQPMPSEDSVIVYEQKLS